MRRFSRGNARAAAVVLVLLGALAGGACAPAIADDADAGSDDHDTDNVDAGADDEPAVGDARVLVHYATSAGSAITLRGDGPGLSWTTGAACTPTENDVWACGPFSSSIAFRVKPLLDDATWAPGTDWIVPPGATLDIFPHFLAVAGRVETTHAFASAILGNSRDVAAYLPPSYDENPAKTYPVLFVHDGQNVFDPALAFGGTAWELDAAIDALVQNGGIEEMIVVAPYNDADRVFEYTPTVDASVGDGGGADAYLDFLVDELAPWVAATYRTDGSAPGIAGSSLGGLVSLYACWTRADVFSRCGVMSPSLWWDEGALLGAIEASTDARSAVRYYVDSGDSGDSEDGRADTIALRDALVDHGWVLGDDLLYVLGVGQAHDEAAWAARAPGALAFLYADPHRVAP